MGRLLVMNGAFVDGGFAGELRCGPDMQDVDGDGRA